MRSLAIVAVVTGCVAGVASCTPAIPALPGKGGPAWVELQSDHFTMWTDAGQQRGADLMKEVEDLRQVVIGAAFHGAAVRGRGLIIAFANEDEVHGYVPDQFAAITMNGAGPFGEPTIVLSASSNSMDTKVIDTHELVHLISYNVIHHQPHWFAEGIAKYFETIQIDAAAGTVDVGRAATARDGSVQRLPHLISVPTMFACTTLGCLNGNFYATAWLMFTYLTNVRPADLAKLEALLDTSPGDGTAAFAQVFGPDGAQTIDGEMRRWLANGSHTILHYAVQLAPHDVRVRPMSDADVLASRAMLWVHFHHDDATGVAALLDQALALDPTNVVARVEDLALSRPHDAAAAKATAAAHPDDWRAWMLLLQVSKAPDDRMAAIAQLCALGATSAAVALPAAMCPVAAAPAVPDASTVPP